MNQKSSEKPRNIDAGVDKMLANFHSKSKTCLDDATILIVVTSVQVGLLCLLKTINLPDGEDRGSE